MTSWKIPCLCATEPCLSHPVYVYFDFLRSREQVEALREARRRAS